MTKQRFAAAQRSSFHMTGPHMVTWSINDCCSIWAAAWQWNKDQQKKEYTERMREDERQRERKRESTWRQRTNCEIKTVFEEIADLHRGSIRSTPSFPPSLPPAPPEGHRGLSKMGARCNPSRTVWLCLGVSFWLDMCEKQLHRQAYWLKNWPNAETRRYSELLLVSPRVSDTSPARLCSATPPVLFWFVLLQIKPADMSTPLLMAATRLQDYILLPDQKVGHRCRSADIYSSCFKQRMLEGRSLKSLLNKLEAVCQKINWCTPK